MQLDANVKVKSRTVWTSVDTELKLDTALNLDRALNMFDAGQKSGQNKVVQEI